MAIDLRELNVPASTSHKSLLDWSFGLSVHQVLPQLHLYLPITCDLPVDIALAWDGEVEGGIAYFMS